MNREVKQELPGEESVHMRSSSQTDAGDGEQPFPQWARQVRKDFLPTNMEEYVRSWAAFFDHYAFTVESWRRRNAGYHCALSSLARFYVSE